MSRSDEFGGREVHPAAELFPLMAADRLKELADDIKEKGLLEPVVQTTGGALLDGRNRYLACDLAGVEVRWETYLGADPWGYVISRNLQRRQLSDRQRAAIAAKYASTRAGRKSAADAADSSLPPTRQQAAELFNVSKSAVERVRRIQAYGTKELQEAVERHDVPLNTAIRVSNLPPDQQQDFVNKLRAGISPKTAAPSAAEAPPVKSEIWRSRVPASRYSHIGRDALVGLRSSLSGLGHLLDNTEGISPEIDAAEAARWVSDLGRERRNLQRLINALKERTA